MSNYYLECISCGSVMSGLVFKCPKCGGLPVFRYSNLSMGFEVRSDKPGIWRYLNYLPSMGSKISRGEGLTPISNIDGILVKNERFNPTGTYSDRASALIASYLHTYGIDKVTTHLEEDFTYSLAYYLSGISELEVLVRDVLALNMADASAILDMKGTLTVRPKPTTTYLEYVNPLTIEGLKTIAFEIVEKNVKVDRIVVPARTGVLAYAIYKGVRELIDIGVGVPYEVVAAMMKGDDIPYITKFIKDLKVVEVDEEDVLKSVIRLNMRGIKTKPISALAYTVAENLGKSIVVMTMGFKTTSYYWRRNNNIRNEISRIMKESDKVTAYEIWKKAPIYTLRGIYKLLQSMERREEICSEVVYNRGRKIKYYKICA